MRLTCTLALVCLIASCAPPKAIVVEEAPEPTKPVVARNTTPQGTGGAVALPPPEKRQLMQINPAMTQSLPDRKDFQPTTPPLTTADRGPNLVVPAPKPQPSE